MDLLDYDSEDDSLPSPVTASDSVTLAEDTKNISSVTVPLPSFISPLLTSTSGDRSRYIPKDLLFLPVAGDWPCLVYIELPSQFLSVGQHLIQNMADILQLPLHSLISRNETNASIPVASSTTPSTVDTASSLPLHISLSKVTTLRQHQVSSFLQTLTTNLYKAKISRFPLRLSETCILINETRSRSFLGLALANSISSSHHHHHPSLSSSSSILSPLSTLHSIQRIIRSIDLTLTDYGKPTYYSSPVIHVTLATVDGDITKLAQSYRIPIHNASSSSAVVTVSSSSTNRSDSASLRTPSTDVRAVESYLLQSRRSNRTNDNPVDTNVTETAVPDTYRSYQPQYVLPRDTKQTEVTSTVASTTSSTSSSSVPIDKDSLSSFTMDFLVYEICCKIGNKVYRFPLASTV